VLGGGWVVSGASDVRAALEAEGHTDIHVTMRPPFDYGYTSTKGDAACGGTFTLSPPASEGPTFAEIAGDRSRPFRPTLDAHRARLRVDGGGNCLGAVLDRGYQVGAEPRALRCCWWRSPCEHVTRGAWLEAACAPSVSGAETGGAAFLDGLA
jgi:hypothetical protein